MAHHKSALKRIRQTSKRTARNKANRTRARNWVKKVRKAIELKDKDSALKLLPQAQSSLDKAARKNALSSKAASRSTSRLAKQIRAIES